MINIIKRFLRIEPLQKVYCIICCFCDYEHSQKNLQIKAESLGSKYHPWMMYHHISNYVDTAEERMFAILGHCKKNHNNRCKDYVKRTQK